jgi:hypothetical protein
MRQFETGATRDTDINKFDYEGFLSPLVLERFGRYMHQHRKQADGSLRDSDNWQKGIPKAQYVKSLIRHTIDFWKLWRGYQAVDNYGPVTIEDVACAILFNVQGFLHETLKEQSDGKNRG